MKRIAAALLVIGTWGLGSSPAAASPLTNNVGSFTGQSSGATARIHSTGTLADGLDVYIGSVLITGDLGTFESYCVDLQHYDIPGSNQATLVSMANWDNKANTPTYLGLG